MLSNCGVVDSVEYLMTNARYLFSFSRDDVLAWVNGSLLPRLLDDSVLLRDTGSVLLTTPRLRQIRDTHGEAENC